MTTFQRVIKYLAIALAISLIASIISGIVTAAAGIIGFFTPHDNGKTSYYHFDGAEITALEIDVEAAHLTLSVGDSPHVECGSSQVRVALEGSTLTVNEEDNLFNKNTYTLNIVLPDIMLNRADIETGAGKVIIESLSTEALELNLGAGEVQIAWLVASKSADIDSGAGKFTINNAIIHNMELDIGIGETDICAVMNGNNNIDCGIGSLSLELHGADSDYSIHADKGVGSFTVNERSVSDGETVGNGSVSVNIDNGVGSVSVTVVEDMES